MFRFMVLARPTLCVWLVVFIGLLAVFSVPVWAADGTVIMTSSIAPWVDPAVQAAIGTVVSAILLWVARFVKDAQMRAAIDMGVQRAGGMAYDFLHTQEGRTDLVSIKNQAVAVGVNHVLGSLPLALQALGVTPDTVHRMVSGELGKLLAVDPTTTLTPAKALLATMEPAAPQAAPNPALQAAATDAGGSAIAKVLAMAVVVIGLTFGLTACSGGQLTAVTNATNATISQAQQKVQAAIKLYGVAKGIAQVAELADPSLVPIVAGVTAAVDPQVAKAQTALNDATADAAALEQLASAINAQANALTLQTAPVVQVVPDTTPATAS